jgi:class 3 adenylate cyclase
MKVELAGAPGLDRRRRLHPGGRRAPARFATSAYGPFPSVDPYVCCRAMSAQLAAVVVTDLVSATKLRVDLGEEAADLLHRVHGRLLRAVVEAHGGSVVKGLGDGVLARFGGAADALGAVVAMQRAVERQAPVNLRIGLSAGDVAAEDGGDLLGTPVIEASRLCRAARGGQILAAALVPSLADSRGGFTYGAVADMQLKGIPTPVSAVEIHWAARPRVALAS